MQLDLEGLRDRNLATSRQNCTLRNLLFSEKHPVFVEPSRVLACPTIYSVKAESYTKGFRCGQRLRAKDFGRCAFSTLGLHSMDVGLLGWFTDQARQLGDGSFLYEGGLGRPRPQVDTVLTTGVHEQQDFSYSVMIIQTSCVYPCPDPPAHLQQASYSGGFLEFVLSVIRCWR